MGTRAERRDTTESAILGAGLRLLSKGGSDALTVRGLARELGLAPSALYRYVHSREDLVQLLLNHARKDLADTVEAAQAAIPRDDLPGRWRSFAHTLRNWSLAHRHEWVMIQRRLVSGPVPEDEHTFRLHLVLLRLGSDFEAVGQYPATLPPPEGRTFSGVPAPIAEDGVVVSERTALAGMAAWHLLNGAIFAEVGQVAGRDLVEADAYYAAMVAAPEVLLGAARPPIA